MSAIWCPLVMFVIVCLSVYCMYVYIFIILYVCHCTIAVFWCVWIKNELMLFIWTLTSGTCMNLMTCTIAYRRRWWGQLCEGHKYEGIEWRLFCNCCYITLWLPRWRCGHAGTYWSVEFLIYIDCSVTRSIVLWFANYFANQEISTFLHLL